MPPDIDERKETELVTYGPIDTELNRLALNDAMPCRHESTAHMQTNRSAPDSANRCLHQHALTHADVSCH